MRKKDNKIKYLIRNVGMMGIVFVAFFALGSVLAGFTHESPIQDQEGEETFTTIKDGKRTNILILGVDARPGDEHARSDTMILASIDPKLDKVVLISIPRDTRVKVEGTSLDKICAANFVGGPEYAMEAVAGFLQTEIDYFVEMDFNGFKDIIDTLGGVTINVPQRMYKPEEDIDLYPGEKRLNGREALAFVRYRDYSLGDIQRTSQQQEFLKALAKEVLQPRTLTKLPKLVDQVSDYVTTNLKLGDMLKMASWAPGFDADSIITQTLPGYFYEVYDDDGFLMESYWVADGNKFPDMLEKLFAGESMVVFLESPYPPNRPPAKKEAQVNKERSKLPSPGHEEPTPN